MNKLFLFLILSFIIISPSVNADIQPVYWANANIAQLQVTLTSPINFTALQKCAANEFFLMDSNGTDWTCGAASGSGTVTSITQGTGITATPNPITGAGSIAFNTTWGDARYALIGSGGGSGLNTWINGTGYIYPNSSFSNNINTTGYINASRFSGKIDCSLIDGTADNVCIDSTGITVESDTIALANISTNMVSWLNTFNSSYHNFWLANISAKTDYVNNASERSLFLSTYNSSYVQIGNDLGGTVTSPTVIDTAGLSWSNITSGWNLNKAWTNTLGWGNISARSLNIAWTGTLGGSNITDGTLVGTKITDGTITTAELATGTLNQANITNTVAACSSQFSRGMGATTQNCATVGNSDMSSGVYSAITGIGTQAQNLNMGTQNITNVSMVNATTKIMVNNSIFINETHMCKVGGGCIIFT